MGSFMRILFLTLGLLVISLPTMASGLRLSVHDLDFGFMPVGENDQDIVLLRNGGPETASEIYCDIEGSTDFQCEETCKILKVAAPACSMIITFTPSSEGAKTAIAYLHSNQKALKLVLKGQGYLSN